MTREELELNIAKVRQQLEKLRGKVPVDGTRKGVMDRTYAARLEAHTQGIKLREDRLAELQEKLQALGEGTR